MFALFLIILTVGHVVAKIAYGARYSTLVILDAGNALEPTFVNPIVIGIPEDDENFCFQYQSIFTPLNMTKLCGDIMNVKFSLAAEGDYFDVVEDYLFITTNSTTIVDASTFGFYLFDNIKNISIYVQAFANFSSVNSLAAQSFIVARGNDKVMQAYTGKDDYVITRLLC